MPLSAPLYVKCFYFELVVIKYRDYLRPAPNAGNILTGLITRMESSGYGMNWYKFQISK